MRNDVIALVSTKVDGANIEKVEKQVFAGKKSVRQSEFYAAYWSMKSLMTNSLCWRR